MIRHDPTWLFMNYLGKVYGKNALKNHFWTAGHVMRWAGLLSFRISEYTCWGGWGVRDLLISLLFQPAVSIADSPSRFMLEVQKAVSAIDSTHPLLQGWATGGPRATCGPYHGLVWPSG